jgi:hypothetical protein
MFTRHETFHEKEKSVFLADLTSRIDANNPGHIETMPDHDFMAPHAAHKTGTIDLQP